jgi:hypothetical protein
MPFVSVTRLRVLSLLYFPIFAIQAFLTSRQAAAADGNLAVKVLRDRRTVFWTSTSWSTEAAMKAFIHSGVHGPVMRKLLEWCDEAAVVHWTQDSEELPSWEEAHRRIQHEGRRSKVNHPSAAQVAYEIPVPKTGGRSDVRLK